MATSEDTGKNAVDETSIAQTRCKNCGGKNHPVERCPHKEQGTRCFNCNTFGHIGKFCPGKVEEAPTIETKSDQTVDTKMHTSFWQVKILHGKTKVNAVVSMGLEDTYMRRSCIAKFDCLPERTQGRHTVQFHNQTVETMGSYELHMTIGHEDFYIQCHVLRDEFMVADVHLGMNFIRDVEIVVRMGNVKIRRTTSESGDRQDYNDNCWAEEVGEDGICGQMFC